MTGQTKTRELTIVRTFRAPAARVFAMWTDPAHFQAWIGPEDYVCTVAEMDARVGGAYRAVIRGPDGEDNGFRGVFREIVPHVRLAMTFMWENDGPSAGVETLIELTFEARGGETIQTFRQSPFRDAERRDSHAEGWSSAFDKLARRLDPQRPLAKDPIR